MLLARDILAWTTVITVTEGYEREDGERVMNEWWKGSVFRIPLGRNPCVEVLTARWRGDKAQFGKEPATADFGKDDITPAAFPEAGFDLDDLGDTPEIEQVWMRIYQRLHGKRPNRKLTLDQKDSLRETVSGWRRLGGPRLRLVIDDSDPASAYASDQVLAAIHADLPDLYLFRVDSNRGGDPGVFVMAPAVLTSRIKMILGAIQAIT